MAATKSGILVDDDGQPWPDDSSDLAKRMGESCLGGALAAATVRDHGFIHLRPQDGGVQVTVPVGRFSLACLTGSMQLLNDMQPARIIAYLHSESGDHYQMFPTIFDFVEHAECLADGGGIEIKRSRVAVPRSSRNLNLPAFAAAQPLLTLWRRQRGELTQDLQSAIIVGTPRRIILVRQAAQSSRLVIEHFSAAINMMRPCQALSLVGHDMEDMYDRDYGSWIMLGYFETLLSETPRLESMLADIRDPDDVVIRARYDRLLLPWRNKTGDRFALCVSLLRNRSLVS